MREPSPSRNHYPSRRPSSSQGPFGQPRRARPFHEQIPGFYDQMHGNHHPYGDDTPPRRRSPSPSNHRRHQSPIDVDDYLSDDDIPGIPTSPRAASSAAISSLPTKRITESDKGDDDKANCPICMEEVTVGSMVSTMPCGHWFHFDCIKPWLEQNGTCPNCRVAYGMEDRHSRSGDGH
ncbi:hypothetical protein LTR85_004868 [Meristemomyces frigidus]|nr:hypothetical protein LTR85_004868 [Meristemomyces frigidus]